MDNLQFLNKILKSDKTIRSAIIFNKFGQIKERDQRSDAELYLNEYDTDKLLKESASSWHYRKEISSKIGDGLYALAEYGNIKRITLPIDNEHLLLITADIQDDLPITVKHIQGMLEEENN